MKTIMKVVKIQAHCYRIPGYEVEDIEQEAVMICLDALDRWDGVRSLERFLAFNLSNRLKTLVRDKLKLQSDHSKVNKMLMNAADISLINTENESSLVQDDMLEDIYTKDLMCKVDEFLPISLRSDYLKMKAGLKVGAGRAKLVKEFLRLLLDELGGDGGEV